MATAVFSMPRADGMAKVTGRARYTADLRLPGMVYAAYLESPWPHARLLQVDVSRARAMPGVVAVLTGEDLLAWRDVDIFYGPSVRDRPVLAVERVRFAGEPVAAVAAEDPWTAEEAVRAIQVEYEPLPAVLDVEQALKPESPQVHQRAGEAGSFHGLGELGGREGNVCYRHQVAWGDVGQGLAGCELVFEDTFRFPPVYHYAMEPHACLAWFRGDRLEVWASAQHPHLVRADLARMFRLPLNRVRVHVPFVGGGFGSKSYIKMEPLAAVLSRQCRRPVLLALSVGQAMRTNHRHGAVIHLRTGVRRDGTLVARECRVLLDTGAYADNGPRVAHAAAMRVLGPYRWQHVRSEAVAVYTHLPPAGSFRAIGAVQTAWASELQLERIARHLGMDPVELRRKNLPARGEVFRPGRRPLDADLVDGLNRARAAIGAVGSRDGGGSHLTGVGVAMGIMDAGANRASVAVVRLHPDGSATLLVSTTEIGQGSRTVLALLAARELGLAPERVRVVQADTASTPYDRSTGASRSTTLMGLAVQRAAHEVRRQLVELAARRWGVAPEQVELAGGQVRAPGQAPVELARLLAEASPVPGLELVGRGYVWPEGSQEASRPVFWEVGMGAARVRVDPETGQVELLDYVGVADAGRAIHPQLAEGQEEGAAVQGFGHTLWESMVFEAGQLVNASLTDYRVPTMADLPSGRFESLLVENGDGPGPHGCRGIGEGGIVPVAPAIAAAVYDACGAWIPELPLHPERVWRAVRTLQKGV